MNRTSPEPKAKIDRLAFYLIFFCLSALGVWSEAANHRVNWLILGGAVVFGVLAINSIFKLFEDTAESPPAPRLADVTAPAKQSAVVIQRDTQNSTIARSSMFDSKLIQFLAFVGFSFLEISYFIFRRPTFNTATDWVILGGSIFFPIMAVLSLISMRQGWSAESSH